ncbi:MAG: OmpA family protein [Saprospiraceae bacterium]|nr:OmpA family protein [Saprospiraceae bacterium]
MRWIVAIVFCGLAAALDAQVAEIALYNPSFEDIPRHSLPPRGWIDCGFPGETPPDVQPSGAWEVYRPAYHGNTYLGIVTRENDTWESVGQRLVSPLLKGQCYEFSMYMCMSSEYWSAVIPDSVKDVQLTDEERAALQEKNFNRPIILRIWGGDGYCTKKELLASSEPVENTYWEKYSFRFEPERDISHLVFEAFYNTPTLFPYNGNLLLDHASTIQLTACDGQEELVIAPAVQLLQPIEKIDRRNHQVRINATVRNIKSEEQITFEVNETDIRVFNFDAATSSFTTAVFLKPGRNTIYLKAKNSAGEAYDETSVYIPELAKPAVVTTPPEPEPTEEPPATEQSIVEAPPPKVYTLMPELNRVEPKPGQIFKVKGLSFKADSTRIERESQSVLDELHQFLLEHPTVSVEIGGHTNGIPRADYCDRLSKLRASSVARYLEEKGISAERLTAKGYGKRFLIASDDTLEGRLKNQRVEIKILSTS